MAFVIAAKQGTEIALAIVDTPERRVKLPLVHVSRVTNHHPQMQVVYLAPLGRVVLQVLVVQSVKRESIPTPLLLQHVIVVQRDLSQH